MSRVNVRMPLETVAEKQFDFDAALAFLKLWPEARPRAKSRLAME
jgi:hypothetical protein